ncbi:hypothetical protein GCM10011415_07240 [Salipiger pallidus]|uniref:Uncharacterized protein n=2 Tax=Salipiger pallidus TaxID=1775170 RepID=A0A8J3EF70_9RHOB|nr:hypothetical protein GCM10011415_07240 [Salipiger pallidus]
MEAFYSSDKAGLGHVTITALQELDMLAQSTEAIATYMADLSHRLDDDTPIDLTPELTAIPLRELGHRLGGFKQVTLTANSPELF